MKTEVIIGNLEAAKQNLIKHGTLMPVAILEDRAGQLTVMGMMFSNEVEKEASFKLIGEKMMSGAYKSFILITDCYYTNDKNSKVRPSQNPNRKQCLMLVYKEDNGKQIQMMLPYEKNNGKIKFEKLFTMKGPSQGRINDIWK